MRRISRGLLISGGVMSVSMIGWAATHVDAGASSGASMLAVHQCSYCHTLHGGGGPSLTASADVEVLCQTCHGPAGSAPRKAEPHINDTNSSYPVFHITCTECHDPHDHLGNYLSGTNLMLTGIDADGTGIARIQTPNSGVREVVFESRGPGFGQPTLHSFADNDEDGNGYYDGICETCHTLTKHHKNSENSRHNSGKSCTASCHLHTTNFQK